MFEVISADGRQGGVELCRSRVVGLGEFLNAVRYQLEVTQHCAERLAGINGVGSCCSHDSKPSASAGSMVNVAHLTSLVKTRYHYEYP